MKMTNDVARRCEEMVRDFAKRKGLTVHVHHNFDEHQTALEFCNPKYPRPKRYSILWGAVATMSEACAAIYADLMVEWHFGNANCVLVDEKDLADMASDNSFKIKNVIFNDPATIVLWEDGTKTIVKCQDGDTYSEELGLAMCIAKKALGNKGNFNEIFKKWLPVESAYPSVQTAPVTDRPMSQVFKRFLIESIEDVLNNSLKKGCVLE